MTPPIDADLEAIARRHGYDPAFLSPTVLSSLRYLGEREPAGVSPTPPAPAAAAPDSDPMPKLGGVVNLVGTALTEADLARLEASGIPRELTRRAQLCRVSSIEGAGLVGRSGAGNYAGIDFPYILPGESYVREHRLRRDHPDMEQKPDGSLSEKVKYLSPPGRSNMLYFVPGTAPTWLQDAALPLVLTEGEKKTLALWALAWHGIGDAGKMPRYLPVGLSGVWNWRGTVGKTTGPDGDRRDVKGTIPDLERLAWQGRDVSILFDTNVQDNPSVRAARHGLTRELQRRGAVVRWFEWPEDTPSSVNGVDDLIGVWGPERVLPLVLECKSPSQGSESRIARIEDLPRVEDVGAAQIEWDVEGVFPRGTLMLLTGEAGSGKSTLACGLGYAVSKGERFLGRATVRRPVLILDAENPSVAVLERFQRLGIATDDDFHIWGQWCGEDPPTPGGAIVVEWIARCEPRPLIVVDSLIRFHPGSENDSADTQKYMSMYRKLTAAGASVVLLHHPGKGENAQLYRGSSDIIAAVDVAYKLSNLGDGSRLSQLELRAFKQRISVTPHLFIRYHEGGFTADEREASKTVKEPLVELIKTNPGTTGDGFEKLAAKARLGRNRARRFLSEGVKAGTVRIEEIGARHEHFWREPEGETWAK